MKVSVLGIDLGKNVFHVYGIDERGQPIVRNKLMRRKLHAFIGYRADPCDLARQADRKSRPRLYQLKLSHRSP
jgi:transposase